MRDPTSNARIALISTAVDNGGDAEAEKEKELQNQENGGFYSQPSSSSTAFS